MVAEELGAGGVLKLIPPVEISVPAVGKAPNPLPEAGKGGVLPVAIGNSALLVLGPVPIGKGGLPLPEPEPEPELEPEPEPVPIGNGGVVVVDA